MKLMKSRSKCAKRDISSPTDDNLWHNLLQDALDTGSLYGLTLQTVLNEGGGGNRGKRNKRGKKRLQFRDCLALLKTLYKTCCPTDPQ